MATFPRKYPHPTFIPNMPTRNITFSPVTDPEAAATYTDDLSTATVEGGMFSALLAEREALAGVTPQAAEATVTRRQDGAAVALRDAGATVSRSQFGALITTRRFTATPAPLEALSGLLDSTSTAALDPLATDAAPTATNTDAQTTNTESEADVFYG